MALLLNEEDVRGCLDMASLIPLMRDTLVRFSSGQCVQPVRPSVHVKTAAAEGFYAVMPAHIREPDGHGAGALGIKSVSFFPDNDARGMPTHLASILYLDAATGDMLAMMDGRLITEMRTAAVSAVSVDLLARPEAHTLALLGSGVQARSHLEAIALVRPLKHVRVWSRTADHAIQFAHKASETLVECPVSAVANVADAVRGADIVVTVSSATEPILAGRLLEPGMHLAVVGSSVGFMREVDAEAVLRSRVVVDSRAAAPVEAGDLVLAVKEGRVGWDHVLGELGEVAAGKFRRESAAEITLFKSLGLAVEDVAAARRVYERAAAKGYGTRWP